MECGALSAQIVGISPAAWRRDSQCCSASERTVLPAVSGPRYRGSTPCLPANLVSPDLDAHGPGRSAQHAVSPALTRVGFPPTRVGFPSTRVGFLWEGRPTKSDRAHHMICDARERASRRSGKSSPSRRKFPPIINATELSLDYLMADIDRFWTQHVAYSPSDHQLRNSMTARRPQ